MSEQSKKPGAEGEPVLEVYGDALEPPEIDPETAEYFERVRRHQKTLGEADGPSFDAQASVAAELALSSVVGLLDTAHMVCRDVLSGSVEGGDVALRLAHGHLLIAIQMLTELMGEDESEDEIQAQDEEDDGDRTEG